MNNDKDRFDGSSKLPATLLTISYSYCQPTHSLTSLDFLTSYSISKSHHDLKHLQLSNSSSEFLITFNDIVSFLEEAECDFYTHTIRIIQDSNSKLQYKHLDLNFTVRASQAKPVELNLLLQQNTRIEKLKTEFNKRFLELEQRLAMLEQSPSPLKSPMKKEESTKLKKKTLHIAVMYAHPLVKSNRDFGKEELVPLLEDPVGFEEECQNIKSIMTSLGNKNKKIRALFEIASYGKLSNVLAKEPVVLHVACHGSYSPERGGYCLDFEEEGKLYELSNADVSSLLNSGSGKASEAATKIVFVSACHSFDVAQVFVNAGVPCVISVQSPYLKIDDKIATKFAREFYRNLFIERWTIMESFLRAREYVKPFGGDSCCCAHDHKSDCMLVNEIKSRTQRHIVHTPKCRDCYKDYQTPFLHKVDCHWVQDFSTSYMTEPWEASMRLENLHLKGNIKLKGDEYFLCCCSPEVKHDECLKFKIHCRKEFEDYRLEKCEEGTFKIIKPNSCLSKQYETKNLRTRNKEMYKIYKRLADPKTRCLVVNGPLGYGKTSLVKLSANYMMERDFFPNGTCWIDCENIVTVEELKFKVFKELPEVTDIQKKIWSVNSKKLLILDDVDKLLQMQKRYQSSQLREFLKDIVINSEIRIIIIINTTEIGKYEKDILDELALLRYYKTPAFDDLIAARIFLDMPSKTRTYLPWQFNEPIALSKTKYFQTMPKTYSNILALHEKLKTNIVDLEKDYMGDSEAAKEQTDPLADQLK